MGEAARKFDLAELMTPEEVAAWLGITRRAVYDMVHRGEFPAESIVRIGTRLRFDAACLRSWLAEKRGYPQKSA